LLEEFVKAGVPAVEVVKRLGKSVVGVHDKMLHFGLEDDKHGEVVFIHHHLLWV